MEHRVLGLFDTCSLFGGLGTFLEALDWIFERWSIGFLAFLAVAAFEFGTAGFFLAFFWILAFLAVILDTGTFCGSPPSRQQALDIFLGALNFNQCLFFKQSKTSWPFGGFRPSRQQAIRRIFEGHLFFYATGFLATLRLAAFFSSRDLNEPLILIKAFIQTKTPWPFWGSCSSRQCSGAVVLLSSGLLSHLEIGKLLLLKSLEWALNSNQNLFFSNKKFMAFLGLTAFSTASFLAMCYLEIFWGTCWSRHRASSHHGLAAFSSSNEPLILIKAFFSNKHFMAFSGALSLLVSELLSNVLFGDFFGHLLF